MRKNNSLKFLKSFLLLTALFFSVSSQAKASNLPVSGDTSFSAAMERFATSAARIVPIFTEEFLKPFADYLMPLAWLVAILCFFVMFITLLSRNEGADKEFWKWLLSTVFLFCVLSYAGDANGDGKFGDVVNYFQTVGNSLAFGQMNDSGKVEQGSFIQNKIKTQREAFNTAYKDFVTRSFTVKINAGDTAVVLPSTNSIEDRLFVKDSKGYSPQRVKDSLNPEGWDMGSLFEWLNISRGIMEIADLFLLILIGLLGACLKMAFPLMVAVSIHKDLRAKAGSAFFWAMGVVTLIVPFFTQVLRFAAFLAGNLAFQAATPAKDYYTFDATTQSVLASGNPVYMIFLMCFIMCIVALLIFASPYLAFQFATGNIVSGMIGAVSGWFSGLASIGITTFTSALGGSYAYQASEQTALRTFGQQVTQAADNRQIQYAQAEGQYRGDVAQATNSYVSGQVSTIGGHNADLISNRANYENAITGIGIDTNKEISTAVAEGNQRLGQNQIDYAASQAQTNSELAESNISATPELSDLNAQQAGANLRQIPGVSSIANLAGVNDDFFRGIDQLSNSALGDNSNREFDIQNSAPINSATNLLGSSPPSNQLPIPSGKDYLPHLDMPKPVQLAPNLPALQTQELPQYETQGGGQPTYNDGGGAASSNYSNFGVPLFRQGDGRWGGEHLGKTATIGGAGCAMTSTAMAISKISGREVNPAQLDRYLDTHGGWKGDSLDWGVAAQSVGLKANRSGWNMKTVNGQLDAGRPVVVGVDYKAGSRGGANGTDHWIALTGRQGNTYFANDPATGKQMQMQLGNDGRLYGSAMTSKGATHNYKTTGELRTFSGGISNARNVVPSAPQFKGSQAQQRMMELRQVPNGIVAHSSGTKNFAASNNGYQPTTVNRTAPPVMNNGVKEMKSLQDMTNVKAKAYAPVARANVVYENKSAINSYKRDAQSNLIQTHTSDQIAIAKQAGQQKSAAQGNLYAAQNNASAVRTNANLRSQYIQYQGAMGRAGISYQTSTNVADMSFARDAKIAEMQKNTSIEAARLQAMSSLIQAVGSTVGHQLGEAFEKFNRF